MIKGKYNERQYGQISSTVATISTSKKNSKEKKCELKNR